MESSQVPQHDPMDDLPEEVQEAVDGVAWIGYLEDDFDFAGHHFVIRTLKGDEELHAAAAAAEYRNTLGESKAWIWAQIGLALQAVDGDENFCPPVGPDKRNFARARLQYCSSSWFWPTAEFIYAKFVELQGKQIAVVEAAQDLSSGSLRDSWPFADSWTEPGASPSEIRSETTP